MVLNSHSDNQNGFRSASRIQELAQHSQILTDWSLRYDQISKGRFEGHLKEVWLDGVQLYEEQLSQSVFQNGEARTDTLCLGVFKALSGETRWMGKPMTLQDVTWSYRRGELMLQTPEYSSLLVLSIPLTLLDDQVDELPRSVCSVRDDILANRIRQQISATIQGVMEHPLQLAGRQARHQFQSEIKELVFSFFDVAHKQNQNIKQNKTLYNELHDRSYPSIGCEPCTRAIKEGEHERAGRWWWEEPAHKECGLHIKGRDYE